MKKDIQRRNSICLESEEFHNFTRCELMSCPRKRRNARDLEDRDSVPEKGSTYGQRKLKYERLSPRPLESKSEF